MTSGTRTRERARTRRERAREGRARGGGARGDAPDGYGQGARAGSRAREGELGEKGWRRAHRTAAAAAFDVASRPPGRISSGTRAKRAFGESASASALAGMWAQALAGVVYTPMDVVKERLQTLMALAETARAGTYRNWTHAIRTIAREEGMRGLFRGYWAQNFVWWPWSAAYYDF